MRIRILGSGTSTGVPIIGCHCEVCRSQDPKNQRTRASILIDYDKTRRFLVDTSPELRLQLLAAGVDKLTAVFYTHMHADHTQGFDDLRALFFKNKDRLPLYMASYYEQEFLRRFSYAFEDTGYQGAVPQVYIQPLTAGRYELEGVQVECVELPHGHVKSMAYRWGSFAYATDFKSFPESAIQAWSGKIDTMVASGIHFREHATHSNIYETLKLFEMLKVRRGFISHLSHEVNYLKDKIKLPDYVDFAYDGLAISCDV